jgi:hypothetical protein
MWGLLFVFGVAWLLLVGIYKQCERDAVCGFKPVRGRAQLLPDSCYHVTGRLKDPMHTDFLPMALKHGRTRLQRRRWRA